MARSVLSSKTPFEMHGMHSEKPVEPQQQPHPALQQFIGLVHRRQRFIVEHERTPAAIATLFKSFKPSTSPTPNRVHGEIHTLAQIRIDHGTPSSLPENRAAVGTYGQQKHARESNPTAPQNRGLAPAVLRHRPHQRKLRHVM